MSKDLEIIKKLEEQTGKKLKRFNIDDQEIYMQKYVSDEHDRVIELAMVISELTDISVIKELKNLSQLILFFNNISDLSGIENLKNLRYLDLRNNRITHLPEEILDLGLEIKWSDHGANTGIYLSANPLVSPPVEIVQQGNDAIRNYFDSLHKAERPLNEIKVLLVGDGGSGKTSLLNQVLGKRFNPDENTTHGITIKDAKVTNKDRKITLHFWDFGGQEIMHHSHQFFLSKRSIYVLVLDGRKDEKTEYWLKHIESFGADSPILVVMNKSDQNHGFDVNRKFLREKYPGIKGFYKMSCKAGDGVKEFLNGLRKTVLEASHLNTPWPESWFNIKTHLEDKATDYITMNQYRDVCQTKELEDASSQTTLLEFLNDLGIMLHLKDFNLQHIGVLNPRWVTEAVYKLITSKELAESKGVLDLQSLPELLDPKIYPADKHTYIIGLMKKFELCYPLDENRILIPELLPKGEPAFDFDTAGALRFRVDYEFLPKSVMPRLMVKLHKDIERHLRWRTGVVLMNNTATARALVRADETEHSIAITVTGEERRDYFAVIKAAIRTINDSFDKLEATEKLPLPDHQETAVDYADLLGSEIAKREDFFVGKLGRSYSTKQLLNDIVAPEHVKQEMDWLSKKMEFHFHFNQQMEASPRILQQQENKQETKVETDVDVDIDMDVEFTVNVQVDLPDLQDDFSELKELLTRAKPEYKNDLDAISNGLDQLRAAGVEEDQDKMTEPMNKLRRFLKKLNDKNSDFHKILAGAKEGLKTAQNVAKTYNRFAQWLGMPQVPDAFL